MKIAAIDVGSNSIHMVIARVGRDHFEIVDRAKEMVGLGRGTLTTGRLSPGAMEAGFRTLATFKRLAEEHGAEPILAVATSAVREAANGGEFALRVWEQLALEIDVITGADEARLIYLAASHGIGFHGRRAAVLDIGGGSVEIAVGHGNEILSRDSLKLGVVRLAERFLHSDPPADAEIRALESYARRKLAPALRRARKRKPSLFIGTSGTLLNLAAMGAALGNRKPRRLHNLALRRTVLARLREEILWRDAEARARMRGLDRKRVDLIPAGVIIADLVLQGLGFTEMRACEWALREGILLDFITRHHKDVEAAEDVPDVRRRSVLHLAERFQTDFGHARHVASLALQLFDGARRLHDLGRTDRELLEYAALLHDVGLTISHSKHHRHSQYLITNGELRGFSPEEIRVMAAVARFHKGAPPRTSHEDLAELDPQERLRALDLAAILRVADSLDRSHHGVVRRMRVSNRDGTVRVRLEAAGGDAALELWGAERKSDLWERRFRTDLRFEVVSRARPRG